MDFVRKVLAGDRIHGGKLFRSGHPQWLDLQEDPVCLNLQQAIPVEPGGLRFHDRDHEPVRMKVGSVGHSEVIMLPSLLLVLVLAQTIANRDSPYQHNLLPLLPRLFYVWAANYVHI